MRTKARIAIVGVGAAGLAMSFAVTERLGDTFDLSRSSTLVFGANIEAHAATPTGLIRPNRS